VSVLIDRCFYLPGPEICGCPDAVFPQHTLIQTQIVGYRSVSYLADDCRETFMPNPNDNVGAE